MFDPLEKDLVVPGRPAPTVLLGTIERLVRFIKQGLGCFGVVGIGRDPAAEAHQVLLAFQEKHPRFDVPLHGLGQLVAIHGALTRKDHDELVPTETKRDIVLVHQVQVERAREIF